MNHPFTEVIFNVLEGRFGDVARDLFDKSLLLQYLNVKTRSANRGSKARAAFANHYALYVLVEDYIAKGFMGAMKGHYRKYEGARFTDLFRRQRELPFGAKLQNHALNSRLNDEFAKYFPASDLRPIVRDLAGQRYWVNEQLLDVAVSVGHEIRTINIAEVVIKIINSYIDTKVSAFRKFIATCREMASLSSVSSRDAVAFVTSQLQPSADARIFEIISFAILKAHYGEQSIFWGWSPDELQQNFLMLYKTGRTNANDGGIDFVMKPLGRFFQVTETVDVYKYFLDIDKVCHFPVTFVVKSTDSYENIYDQLHEEARRKYDIDAVIERYMSAVEEIINIPHLLSVFEALVVGGKLPQIMDEIVLQSRIEFNSEDDVGM
ncbi:MAG: restriction endonuclease [Magnetococcales bacterium]|nr:restriction endonuclease [Magnetococcales bacterium]